MSGPKGEGLAILVDDEDYELLSRFKWYAKTDKSGEIYAQTWISPSRLLVPAPVVDHVNGNTLDNTRGNLREATYRQNSMNRGMRSDCKTGYKGVILVSSRRQYRARIQVGDKRIHSGYYPTAIEAARAYDAMARKYFGEWARLNFPEEQNHVVPSRLTRLCARAECGAEFQVSRVDAIYCSKGCADMAAVPVVEPVYPEDWGRRPRNDSLSGYKGVGVLRGKTQRWQARISGNGKRLFLGNFDTPEDAARAYDKAARELYGEHAWLNFPDEAGESVA